MNSNAVRSLVAASVLGLASCGGGGGGNTDPDPPDPLPTASIEVVSGNSQSGAPNTELPDAVVVRVEDSAGSAVQGQLINFVVVEGGGNVFAGSALSDATGTARERWTLGDAGPQRLEARAVDSQTGAAIVFATFNATAVPPPPAITTQPSSQRLSLGQVARLEVIATGTETLTYQWSKNGVAIPGATVSTYETPAMTLGDAGASYVVLVSDAFGGTTESDAAVLSILGFVPTGPMSVTRTEPRSILLGDGTALVLGGRGPTGPLDTAEVYDPATEAFMATGQMSDARDEFAVVPLGLNVLVIGGYDSVTTNDSLASAEIYDPASGIFAATGNLTTNRSRSAVALLGDGRVLVAGGFQRTSGTDTILDSAEVFDAVTETFSATGSMSVNREHHTATLLGNGKVLVAGGYNGTVLASAELYDPTSGTFSPTGSMSTPRYLHTATLLSNGTVLLTGGSRDPTTGDGFLASAELYDPATETFTPVGDMSTPRFQHTATLLQDGMVLVVGGQSGAPPGSFGIYTASADLYDPALGTFARVGDMGVPRYVHSAVLLNDGKVLVAGGDYTTSTGTVVRHDSAELYDPIAIP